MGRGLVKTRPKPFTGSLHEFLTIRTSSQTQFIILPFMYTSVKVIKHFLSKARKKNVLKDEINVCIVHYKFKAMQRSFICEKS